MVEDNKGFFSDKWSGGINPNGMYDNPFGGGAEGWIENEGNLGNKQIAKKKSALAGFNQYGETIVIKDFEVTQRKTSDGYNYSTIVHKFKKGDTVNITQYYYNDKANSWMPLIIIGGQNLGIPLDSVITNKNSIIPTNTTSLKLSKRHLILFSFLVVIGGGISYYLGKI
jgi:hypothetical protein